MQSNQIPIFYNNRIYRRIHFWDHRMSPSLFRGLLAFVLVHRLSRRLWRQKKILEWPRLHLCGAGLGGGAGW